MADSRDPKRSDNAAARGRRALPLARPGQTQLEQATIMNRLLAAQYGAAYVQLAVFAIDIDRAYVEDDGEQLPFGWEVFVTECYLLGRIDREDGEQTALVEDTCIAILEQEPDDQGFGSQLLFAVYDAVERGLLPQELSCVFERWRKRPKQLLAALTLMWSAPERELSRCAQHCLAQALDPPLAGPTREALRAMQQQRWGLPAARSSDNP